MTTNETAIVAAAAAAASTIGTPIASSNAFWHWLPLQRAHHHEVGADRAVPGVAHKAEYKVVGPQALHLVQGQALAGAHLQAGRQAGRQAENNQ